MCGIAAVLSCTHQTKHEKLVSAAQRAIRSRGPDLLGIEELDCSGVALAGPFKPPEPETPPSGRVRAALISSVLHMRGPDCAKQPAVDPHSGNILIFNGEIFAGFPASVGAVNYESDGDTQLLLKLLSTATSEPISPSDDPAVQIGNRLVTATHPLVGPWAFVFWHAASGVLAFGRDPIGRRSLLLHRSEGSLLLSSVAVPVPRFQTHVVGHEHSFYESFGEWVPVGPNGISTFDLRAWAQAQAQSSDVANPSHFNLTHCPWPERTIVGRELTTLVPTVGPGQQPPRSSIRSLANAAIDLLNALAIAVKRRVRCLWGQADSSEAPIAILFSGGIDCMVLAFLVGLFVPNDRSIDLVSVCFAAPNHDSPDRLNAIEGAEELRRLQPHRRWRLVCVNENHQSVVAAESQILALIFPQTSNMDFHIGAALWFASRGYGHRAFCNHVGDFNPVHGRGDHRQHEHAAPLRSTPSLLGRPSHSEELGEGASIQVTASHHDSDVRSDGTDFLGSLLSQVHEHSLRAAIATCGTTESALQSWVAPAEDAAATSSTAGGVQPRKRKTSHVSRGNDAPKLEKRIVCVGLPKEVMASLQPPQQPRKGGLGTQIGASRAAREPQDYQCRRIAKPRCANAMCKMCCQKIQAFRHRSGDCVAAVACSVKGHAPRIDLRDTGGAGSNRAKLHPCPQLPTEFWMEQKASGPLSTTALDRKAPCNQLLSSTARALVSGLGADEQLGGYGRHRTAFRKRGWPGLQHELDVDIQRLWLRNLGRDGRCISAHGKEARFPFLDEGVLEAVQRLPIHARCDPRLPVGVGDKLVLRVAAHLLGLRKSASRTKRAIQFGCRISKRMAVGCPGDEMVSASERGQFGGSIRQTKGTTQYQPRSSKYAETISLDTKI